MSGTRPNVVVVGAGFGGIEAAKALPRAPVDVTLVDRQNHHCFQPLLYQVATAVLSPADIAWPIRTSCAARTMRRCCWRKWPASTPPAAACCSAARSRCLTIISSSRPARSIPTSATTNGENSRRASSASSMRPVFAAASCWPSSGPELTNDAAEQQRQLTFALVGGGATGVEMAGATAEIARLTLARDFRRIDPRSARVILLEAGPRILPALASDLSDYTMRALTKMDAEVRTSTRVTACDRRGVDLDGGRINAGTAIWAAGVQASPAAR